VGLSFSPIPLAKLITERLVTVPSGCELAQHLFLAFDLRTSSSLTELIQRRIRWNIWLNSGSFTSPDDTNLNVAGEKKN